MTVHSLPAPATNGSNGNGNGARAAVRPVQAAPPAPPLEVEQLGQAPPHDIGAEESVLGAAMLAPYATDWLLANLLAADFYRPAHRTVFETIAELARDSAPVDATTVAAALQFHGLLANLGGHPFLVHLIEAVPSVSNVGYYGRIVRVAARARALIDFGRRATVLGRDATLDPDRAVALVQGMLDELARDGEEIGLRPEDLLQAIRERQCARVEGRVASWGLRSLDALFEGGMFGGDVIVLAAQTSFGKSSLAIQAAAHNAESGHVLYATYEMTPADTGKHTFAQISGHSLSDAAAFLDSDSLAGAREAHNSLDLTVFRHQPDAARLVHEVRTLHARRPLRLIVVDYLQKIPPPAGVRYGTRAEAVGDVSRLLKALALACDAPLIEVAQLNRASNGPDQRPRLENLRESGAIEQDADGVVFIHKEDRADTTADLILAKNRMGPLGERKLRWLAQQAVFADF